MKTKKAQRVISLVPSWTETLIEAGIEVVGRSRYCIHPEEVTVKIPVVGGTKDLNWEKLTQLQPDLVLLDREENPKFFAEKNPFPWWSSHVTSLETLSSALGELASIFENPHLRTWADQAQKFPSQAAPAIAQRKIVYIIWKDPWMCVGQNTYIADVARLLGYRVVTPLGAASSYPIFDWSDFTDDSIEFWLSSEPYPFHKKKEELAQLGKHFQFVDGESFSWFGIRSLRFLASILGK
ncbi:MAG: helical backbone metal receptor [Bdellovibrio sp.]